jgi:hypothetical protein
MTEGNYSNVGHRGPVYKGLGAMNPCHLSICLSLSLSLSVLSFDFGTTAINSFPSEAHIFCLSMNFPVSSLKVFSKGNPFLILADSPIITWNLLAVVFPQALQENSLIIP